jgi:subtilisin family serine protease
MTAMKSHMRSTAVRRSIAAFVIIVGVVACARAVLTAQSAGAEKLDPALLAAFDRESDASYLVVLRERADLSAAHALTDRSAQGRFVHTRLQRQANESQVAVRAFLLARQHAGEVSQFRPFWIINAMAVRSRKAVAVALARFPEVERIVSPVVAKIPTPQPSPPIAAAPLAAEWNLTKIGAPTLWSLGVKGQGITVANIDTGVQFDHPALVAQYRGNLGGGVFDHNYNWWDASGFFGGPGDPVPTDTDGHGTHTMGTMVGDDGGANQIGVAPKATWMACKACAGDFCSFFGLLECGQFILAPWNLAEQNANPDLRPHVVNNSWSFGLSGFDIYRGIVQNWRAAGIFPAFAAGNDGPGCFTARSPGDYPESFASGATNMLDAIADFSGRGPSLFAGIVKPDAAAPGVAVRSSVPTNRYAAFSGTSMASPHTAGLVALLWSYYPGLVRDIDSTERKLRPAAQIINTTQACGFDGPTSHPNNVFGWGRHDAVSALMPANAYTDKSVYSAGEPATLRLSFVNPFASVWTVDLHFGLVLPDGVAALLSSQPVTLPALAEFFDLGVGVHKWSTETAGPYVWFAILTNSGADPANPANYLSFDSAPMIKQ